MATEQLVEYVYHITSADRLDSIREKGLLPTMHDSREEPVIFVDPERENVEVYTRNNAAVLRITLPYTLVCEDDGEYVLYERVPPERIEVARAQHWVRMSDLSLDRNVQL